MESYSCRGQHLNVRDSYRQVCMLWHLVGGPRRLIKQPLRSPSCYLDHARSSTLQPHLLIVRYTDAGATIDPDSHSLLASGGWEYFQHSCHGLGSAYGHAVVCESRLLAVSTATTLPEVRPNTGTYPQQKWLPKPGSSGWQGEGPGALHRACLPAKERRACPKQSPQRRSRGTGCRICCWPKL